ncbi:MAG: radical SAM protein, partial [Candidatus Moraniibacteriota bacterium]
MKNLFLMVNSVCDIACTHCFYTTGYEKRSRDRILPRQAGHVAKRIAEARFGTVILTGGDPLHSVHKKETYELVSALKANALRIIINTSAARLSERDFDRLVELAVDRIDVSIDSHDPAVHDAQRGRHTDAVAAIRGLIQRGMPLSTTTVATARN